MIEPSKQRFDALAGYTRDPKVALFIQEAAWFSIDADRLIGLVAWDRQDHDFGWVVLGRDQRLRFRAIDGSSSHPTFNAARDGLAKALLHHLAQPEESYHQGDECGPPVDFFSPTVPPERFHPNFRILKDEEHYSPARELIAAMMRFHEDVDGNFIEQFQTTAFDQRLWELYLFATFNELGYAQQKDVAVPDFLLRGLQGQLAAEATTLNPPHNGDVPQPKNLEAFREYIDNYVPLKLSRSLTRKLYHKKRYWKEPSVENIPFVIAVQDFHAPGSMSFLTRSATEYVFGVRHSVVNGRQRIDRLRSHSYQGKTVSSNFFELPESENVSAVMLNPLGTIAKFNRMGYVAGFGSRHVKMAHMGVRRGEGDPEGPGLLPFEKDVNAPTYQEDWIEGAIILHNPHARVPLEPRLIPGANHEFLQSDGTIISELPDFHPYISRTIISIDEGNSP